VFLLVPAKFGRSAVLQLLGSLAVGPRIAAHLPPLIDAAAPFLTAAVRGRGAFVARHISYCRHPPLPLAQTLTAVRKAAGEEGTSAPARLTHGDPGLAPLQVLNSFGKRQRVLLAQGLAGVQHVGDGTAHALTRASPVIRGKPKQLELVDTHAANGTGAWNRLQAVPDYVYTSTSSGMEPSHLRIRASAAHAPTRGGTLSKTRGCRQPCRRAWFGGLRSGGRTRQGRPGPAT